MSPLCEFVNAFLLTRQTLSSRRRRTRHHLSFRQPVCHLLYLITTIGPRNHGMEGPDLIDDVTKALQL
jgi:hypothetical protein